MKILVTGGMGFIGLSIARKLIELGHQVKTLGRSASSDFIDKRLIHYQIDLTDKNFDRHILNDIDVVFHVAAKAGVEGNYKEYYDANFIATRNILAASKKHGVKYFIFTSSPSVVFSKYPIKNGNENLPYTDLHISPYATTKAMAEKDVLRANDGSALRTIALRPHLVWGEGDSHLLPRVIKKHLDSRLKIVGNGMNKVDLTHIENVTFAHISAMNALVNGNDVGGKAYFISQNEPISLWPWLNQLFSKLDLPPIKRKVSFRKAYLAGHIAESVWRILNLKGELPMSRFVACQLSHDHWFSNFNAERDLGYKPVLSMDEALVKTLPWLKALTFKSTCD